MIWVDVLYQFVWCTSIFEPKHLLLDIRSSFQVQRFHYIYVCWLIKSTRSFFLFFFFIFSCILNLVVIKSGLAWMFFSDYLLISRLVCIYPLNHGTVILLNKYSYDWIESKLDRKYYIITKFPEKDNQKVNSRWQHVIVYLFMLFSFFLYFFLRLVLLTFYYTISLKHTHSLLCALSFSIFFRLFLFNCVSTLIA